MNPYLMLVCAVLASALPPMLGAQSEPPATRRAHEIVALINTATPAAIRAYADSAFAPAMQRLPIAAHLNFFEGMHDRSRGLDWVEVQDAAPLQTTVLVKQKLTGELAAILVRVDAAAPYRISGLGGAPPRPKVAVKEPHITTDAAMAAALKQYVTTLAQADLFSGTVLLAKDGVVLYAGAFGQANKDFGAANTRDTKFNLGSMNKMFTSVLINQLVEQGKLSYDDPLSKFVPDYPSAAAAQKIHIKNLLTHTAGLGSYFNEEFDKSSRARFRTVDEMMQLAKGDSLAFEPGTQWSYSNTGMLVAGKVVEVVSKQDYFTYVREHVYKPAGMLNTDAYELDHVNPNLAVGYQAQYAEDGTKEYRNNIFQHVIRGGPAGGGYSTVDDLLRFAEALKAGKLVSAQTFDLMTTPKPDVHSPGYGFGFEIDPSTGVVGHSGGFPGISSNLDIFKGTGYVGVVLSNYGGAGQLVTQKIRTLVKNRTTP